MERIPERKLTRSQLEHLRPLYRQIAELYVARGVWTLIEEPLQTKNRREKSAVGRRD
jgi:hypothetical protein